ncbi:MAG: hypothetical protein HN576_09455 [Bacteriovoracaceae bacterium]|nr:hypothetical protein [Bacteriovoracaceae bacterium]
MIIITQRLAIVEMCNWLFMMGGGNIQSFSPSFELKKSSFQFKKLAGQL